MTKKNKRIYFIWIHNNTDSRDDEVLKVKASSEAGARKAALIYADSRRGVSVGMVFDGKSFKEYDPEWHALLWGVPAKETYDYMEKE